MHAMLPDLSRIHQIAHAHPRRRPRRDASTATRSACRFCSRPRRSLAFFDCGGVRLMLSPPSPGFDHPGSVLYFAVDDIQAMHRTLSRRGVVFSDGAAQDRDACRIARCGSRPSPTPKATRWR